MNKMNFKNINILKRPYFKKGNCKIWLVGLVIGLASLGGCKKFLNIDALDSLSGNNFWASQVDVEKYTIGIYAQMRAALLSNYLNPTMGDWRGGYWVPYNGAPGGPRSFISKAAQNDMRYFMNPESMSAGSSLEGYWGLVTAAPKAWKAFYKMIAAANIMYTKVDEVPATKFSETSRKRYKAEAVYLRSLAYFYLVRMFGDVPYYTEAYHAAPIGKTSMITIFQNCVKDLGAVAGDLPWTYDDPANVAVRAMRGGALILMMEMNMWMAGFDDPNKVQYWQATDSLGKELIEDNGGAYALIPIRDYPVIFTGKSKEGLIELSRNANYGEGGFGFDSRNYDISNYVMKSPAVTGSKYDFPFSYIDADFMDKLYPPGEADDRKTLWFPVNYATPKDFEFYKFFDITQIANGSYPRGSVIICRYADAFLLRAEALADLGEEDGSIEMLNVVRARANAKLYVAGEDQSLSDAIWYERVKEFMGESCYYFDLVRTKRILDSKYCQNPIGVEAFKQGAWAWPIPKEAQNNNPYLSLSGYWQ